MNSEHTQSKTNITDLAVYKKTAIKGRKEAEKINSDHLFLPIVCTNTKKKFTKYALYTIPGVCNNNINS